MHFQKLRLTGFKSFVEPTEFRVEPGVTGVVGPNGCGKSNLLEALRWVMGANSAKAMRAGGMDEVIFAGTDRRPGRSHAEVSLTIDNADRKAPAAFNGEPVLEVVRRIDRGEGSTYRINGREVRARDVQLLFADASTGSNSPALVRQGQISELIAAKPQNRRLILEEAAGVSGLHSRRHEAELRLRAAEANVARIDDIASELEGSLARLRREARQAERFKKLSAEIRALKGAVLVARWSEAGQALAHLQGEARSIGEENEAAVRAAAAAAAKAAEREMAIKPLREAETTAAAILHRLEIEKDRLEREHESLAAEKARLEAELARLAADRAREAQIVEEAAAALTRIAAETAELEAIVAGDGARMPELTAAAEAAEAARAEADAALEALAAQAAAVAARRQAAEQRVEEANARANRTRRALDQARAERERLPSAADPALETARAEVERREAEILAARAALEAAEEARAAAVAAEAAARETARGLEDELARLAAEAKGLAGLVQSAQAGDYPSALDAVAPAKGYEAALAAALGDDLDAALDARAASYWGGAEAAAPAWPKGVEPLAAKVKAPPQLAARLALVGVVGRDDGGRLQAGLAQGARLVSREGDLWRWDGFVSRAEAPRPAAIRLEQKARLADIEAEIAGLKPAAGKAAQALIEADAALKAADLASRAARQAPAGLDQALGVARQGLERLERENARREVQVSSLDDVIGRFAAELAELEGAVLEAEAEVEAEPASEGLAARLSEARAHAAERREAAGAARTALDVEAREREGRRRRLESLGRDSEDWAKRGEAAKKRVGALDVDRQGALAAQEALHDAPASLAARRERLMDELGAAEGRRNAAADALAAAEQARADADRAARQAESDLSDVRERRATLEARLEAAAQRLAEIVREVREASGLEPQALAAQLAAEAMAVPAGPEGMEAHLWELERQRDAIGPVNLRAEEDATSEAARLNELKSERADLTAAIAKLREGIDELNGEGRERLLAAFGVINEHFKALFTTLFEGGQAELRLIESEDPLEAGLEIFACPPGKRLSTMSLMSGGEQALTATALIFAVFLANPAPICVLDEVDAPLDDANVERFCNMLDDMRRKTATRFIAITHNPVTMARMDRLFGVTMAERGVSQLVSVDLTQAEALAAE